MVYYDIFQKDINLWFQIQKCFKFFKNVTWSGGVFVDTVIQTTYLYSPSPGENLSY